LTLKNAVGAGLGPVPITASLQGLLPNTRYIVRVLAINTAGADEDTISFTTPGVRPVVTTVPVTGTTSPQATLNGTVNANGSTASVWFEWGTDPSLLVSDSIGVTDAGGFVTVARAATVNTAQSTTYFYRIVARNPGGVAYGSILSFTTGGPLPAIPPTSVTDPAWIVTATIAILRGTVNPNGWDTDVWFEWGEDPSAWKTTGRDAIGNGQSPVTSTSVPLPIAPNVTYYFRVVAENIWGTSNGSILSFTAPPDPNVTPPTVTTDNPTVGGDLVTTLNGTALANGSPTTVWFEVASDAAFTNFVSTAKQSIGSGTSPVPFSETYSLGGTLWYRAVASNAGGTVRGSIIAITP